MVLILLALLTYSALVIWSASGQDVGMMERKIGQIAMGVVIMIVMAQIPPRVYEGWAPYLYIFCIILLVAVDAFGAISKGAQRWLDLGIVRFQPSEIAKIAVPLMVARFINRDVCPPSLKNTGIALVLIFLPTLLVAAQPDLGTSILIALSGLFVLFLSGLSWRLIGIAVVLVAAFIPILWFFLMHDYQRQRVMMLLDPETDPLGAGYHIIQSKICHWLWRSARQRLAARHPVAAGVPAGTPYRLYLRRSRRRVGPDWRADPACALYSADHARTVDRRSGADHLWPGHGRWFNVDFIRLCLRKYWYGEWYFTGGGRTVAAGELRGLRPDRIDGRVWYRDVDPYPQKNVVEKRLKGFAMRKQWLGICIAAGLLAACRVMTCNKRRSVLHSRPSVMARRLRSAAPIRSMKRRTRRRIRIMSATVSATKSSRIRQTLLRAGFAAIYDAEPNSNLTASGETFDPTQLTAAHPTLPIPSYARITNLANGRMIVVRINDRGPYGNDRVISLSRASADRLNTSNNTKVRIDPIIVAPDGSLSGPGMACTTVAKQTYALPARPNLDGGDAAGMNQPAPTDVRPISNSTLKPEDSVGAPVNSGGFLGAPTPLNSGVLESSEPAAATATAPAAGATPAAPVTAPGSIQGSVAPAAAAAPAPLPLPLPPPPAPAVTLFVHGGPPVSDQARAQQYQQRLSQQFSVPGRVMQNGAVWRIQLGPFADKAQASAVQQRLQSEAQLQSLYYSRQLKGRGAARSPCACKSH